jgi:hypothetical protein
MGNCCKKETKTYKKETGTNLLEKLITELPKDTKVLVIRVIGANNLPSADAFSNSADPFVQMSIRPADDHAGDQKQTSSKKSRTLNPRWEPPERFQFIVGNPKSTRLVVSL